MSNKLVYAVPTKKYAEGEAFRFIKDIRKNSPTSDSEFQIIISQLRKMNPFVFEEILLHCCERYKYFVPLKRGFIKDNGVDGYFSFQGRFYVIQAKLYSGEADHKHLIQFSNAIEWHHAAKGFFFHTGRTSDEFKKVALASPTINIVSGQKLIDFLLGRKPLYISNYYQNSSVNQVLDGQGEK
ncbi:MAG: restriction endonuclease [Brasilonema octagenarum HA4186-MV1]|jgi:restriction system protein|nr:restriction endonuclease [Brasilonema octagenarum HA4186-MV1]